MAGSHRMFQRYIDKHLPASVLGLNTISSFILAMGKSFTLKFGHRLSENNHFSEAYFELCPNYNMYIIHEYILIVNTFFIYTLIYTFNK